MVLIHWHTFEATITGISLGPAAFLVAARSFRLTRSMLILTHLTHGCTPIWPIQKHELMGHVAHQTICMQYILELAKQLDYDPRACVDAFFSKIQVAEVEYKQSFEDELTQFKERIRKRSAEKLEEVMKEYEEEEKQKRLGPGGLDPEEVYDALPEELRNCFDSRDVELLQETISKMDEEDAKYHMKRCVDSGLWVPDANKKEKAETVAETSE